MKWYYTYSLEASGSLSNYDVCYIRIDSYVHLYIYVVSSILYDL